MQMEEEIFKRTKVDFDRLLSYGFIKKGKVYKYSKCFLDDFQAEIEVDESGHVLGKVFDLNVGEEYINFRIERQVGEFVSQVREEYRKILEEIRACCFQNLHFMQEQTNRIEKKIKDCYQDEPEFAWENSPGFGIFRNPRNEKWYGLIMNIDRSKIEPKSSGEIEVINVKLDPEKIQELLTKDGFYPAYHMNKKNWITISLDDTLPDDLIMECIDESHRYTEEPEEWIVPANPKFYDVISAFEKTDTITWKQSSNVHVKDLVYLYVGSPYSAILYQCEATEVNIPYEYQDQNLSMNRVMKIKLLKKYSQDQYTFSKLNEYGIHAIRGPRSMPKKLSREMNQ